MAYEATVNVHRVTVSGRRQWVVSITESEAAAASEFEVAGLPELATPPSRS